MKKKPAIIAAFITTLVIGAAMLLVGMNAFYNPNTVPVSNSPTDPALRVATGSNVAAVSANTSTSDQVKQLQSLVAQYQQQVQQLQSQLSTATNAAQQYQSLLSQLQSRGIIRIDSSGNVYINRRGD